MHMLNKKSARWCKKPWILGFVLMLRVRKHFSGWFIPYQTYVKNIRRIWFTPTPKQQPCPETTVQCLQESTVWWETWPRHGMQCGIARVWVPLAGWVTLGWSGAALSSGIKEQTSYTPCLMETYSLERESVNYKDHYIRDCSHFIPLDSGYLLLLLHWDWHYHPQMIKSHWKQTTDSQTLKIALLSPSLHIHAVLSRSDSLQPCGLQPARLLCPWEFSRQEYRSGLPCTPPGDLPNPGIEPRSPAMQADSLPSEPPRNPQNTVAYPFSRGPSWPRNWTRVYCLTDWFWAIREAQTGVGSHSLLQGIFPTQGLNSGVLHCRQMLYCLNYQGSPEALCIYIYLYIYACVCTYIQIEDRVSLHTHIHMCTFIYIYTFLCIQVFTYIQKYFFSSGKNGWMLPPSPLYYVTFLFIIFFLLAQPRIPDSNPNSASWQFSDFC